MSERFYDEDELYDMQKHPSVRAISIGQTKPYDCIYPVIAERPRIVERSKDGERGSYLLLQGSE